MSKYTDQYVLYGYWDYAYSEGDVLATEASASIDGVAITVANAQKILLANASITGNAVSSGTCFAIRSFSANISSNAQAEANSLKIVLADTSLTGITLVSGLPNIIASGSLNLSSLSSINCIGNIEFIGVSNINGISTVIPVGYIYGEEWTDKPIGNNTWLSQ